MDARTGDASEPGSQRYYPTREQALEEAQKLATRRHEEGTNAFQSDELTEYGKTVRDAVQFYLAHLRAQAASRPIAEAIQKLLARRRQEDMAKQSMDSLRAELARFDGAFPGQSLASIAPSDVGEYLSLARTSGTRNTRRKHIMTLFSFAMEEKWLTENPVKAIKKLPEKFDVQTLDAVQMSQLLGACDTLEREVSASMRAYLALAGFAGIRPEELRKLQWRDINLVAGFVFIGSRVSKVGQSRSVPLSENCKAWLTLCQARSGTIAGDAFRYRFDAVRAAAGYSVRGKPGAAWPSDVLRHSFASYWLAVNKNRAELAEHMGNSVQIISKHYRRHVSEAEGRAWFDIMPEREGKIVRMV